MQPTIRQIDTFTEIRQRIVYSVEFLLQHSCSNEIALARTHEIGSLVDSLPFATAQYGVAKNRIRNALKYFQSEEFGAASYELRLLLGQLARTFV